jgi:transcriptional regulator with XRE-family HTH domain
LEERPGEKGYELVRQLNISCGSLSEIERGKNLPSASTLASIHLNTNLSVGYVLTGQIAGKKKSALRSLVVEVDDKVFNVVLKRKK